MSILSSALLLCGCGGPVRTPPRPQAPPPRAPEPSAPPSYPGPPPAAPALPPGTPPGAVIEEGMASWYGPGFHGKRTANGEVYDMHKFTAAHRTLPFDTMLTVVNAGTGARTVVRVNDRGPFAKGRILDMSYAAAQALDAVGPGVIPVRLLLFAEGAPKQFFVQAGAFGVRENAERLRDSLSREFSSAFTARFEEFWRVRLGPYAGEDEARRALERLRLLGQDGFVVAEDK